MGQTFDPFRLVSITGSPDQQQHDAIIFVVSAMGYGSNWKTSDSV